MEISYNWLRELTDVSWSPRELASRLTLAGLAVDAVREAGEDFVLEFDLTSNRPDCLSHLGIAREAAALAGAGLRLPELSAKQVGGRVEEFTSVEIEDARLCPRYAARVVRGVKVAPSPDWLARRLQTIGQRPINNVADITNFVLHELGQPLHAFDLAKLTERRIVVRRARAGERIKTLDGVERELDEQMLVIGDAARAVALAGVMGGEETEISEATTDVLVESAYFDPQSVRRTSKLLGLQTDASYRFERGVDYEGVRRAQDRCVALICEVAGGTATVDAFDVYPRKIEPTFVTFRPRRVEELTGLRVAVGECIRLLAALGFERRDSAQAEDEGEPIGFVVPSWRTDVSIEEDLVEEVARLVGYENIGESLPPSPVTGEYLAGDRRRRAARQALTACGLCEAVNISFIDEAGAMDEAGESRFELVPGLQKVEGEGAFVRLSNPIIEGARLMRPTLLPGLLDSVRHNFNHGTRSVRLFETGRVFASSVKGDETASGEDEIVSGDFEKTAPGEGGGRPNEVEAFALVLTGEALEEGRATGRELDFFNLKGALEAATDAMRLGELQFAPAAVRHLREGQSARILFGGAEVGSLGRLSEELAAAYKFRQPVFVAEVNLSALLAAGERPIRYAPLPRFPSVVRDVSLVAPRRAAFGEMRRAILSLDIAECRGVSLVDVYEGANVPEGKRSLTLRVEYRADERTLRDEEVEAMHARVVAALEGEFGAQLRT
ncbi:MAG TPA: phenylalanine--tRNA ligase subunit beta [Pyrinomonadaceae bacterium]|jgi:phenylalanyl-tRNA synthetase beta chain|nr:phenylalanine--tRNA ligase subunit beta [Pyrinomonadaceae bacterium]